MTEERIDLELAVRNHREVIGDLGLTSTASTNRPSAVRGKLDRLPDPRSTEDRVRVGFRHRRASVCPFPSARFPGFRSS